MVLTHVLREDVINVHLDNYIDFYSEVYKIKCDTYGELVILCEKYEESPMETWSIRSEVESENSNDLMTAMFKKLDPK